MSTEEKKKVKSILYEYLDMHENAIRLKKSDDIILKYYYTIKGLFIALKELDALSEREISRIEYYLYRAYI